MAKPRRADGSGTKTTKVTKFTKKTDQVFVIFVIFVIFVPLPSARFSPASYAA